MYLDEISNLKTYRSGKPQFANTFKYWRNQLFEQCNKLFTWEGLNFPQREIETRLILWGRCGILKGKNEIIASDINEYGITNYYDVFTDFNYTTPLENGRRKNNIDGIVINNNALKNPTINLIDRYAMLLTHTELSFVIALVNGRATKTTIATSNKTAEEVRKYQNKLYNGCNDVIVDKAFLNLDIKDNDSSSLAYVKQLYDIRQSLLYSFYEDIGIKKNQQKRERLVSDEVSADLTLLKLNIKDMYDARKEACEKINKIFNTNWSVKCNVDYDADGTMKAETEGVPDEKNN